MLPQVRTGLLSKVLPRCTGRNGGRGPQIKEAEVESYPTHAYTLAMMNHPRTALFLSIILLSACASRRLEAEASPQDKITARLKASETRFDVKCLTTVKNISNLMFGYQTDDGAFHRRERIIQNFAAILWLYAQNLHPNHDTLSAADIDDTFRSLSHSRLEEREGEVNVFLRRPDPLDPSKASPPIRISALDYFDYGRTSNSWKTLFSLTQDGRYVGQFTKPLTDAGLERLAFYIDTYAIVLIKRSIEMARTEGSPVVYARHLDQGEANLLIGPAIYGWSVGGNYAARAFTQAMIYAKIKSESLLNVNGRISTEGMLDIYSRTAGAVLTEDGRREMEEILKGLFLELWRRAQHRTPPGHYLISGETVYDVVQEVLPYRMDDLSNMVFFPDSKVPILYQEYLSDTLRDDGFHWRMARQLLEEQGRRSETSPPGQLIPLDVGAMEELTEVISTYAVPLMREAGRLSKRHHHAQITAGDFAEAHRDLLAHERGSNRSTALIPEKATETPYARPIFSDETRSWGLLPFQDAELLADDAMRDATLMAFDAFRGVATADFNNDGYPDLLVAHEGAQSALYLNRAGKRFDHWQVGLDKIRGITAIAAADYDNDGCADVFLSRPYVSSLLWKGDCHGQFTDVTRAANLWREEVPTTGAIWFDYDNDGRLDLYLLSTGDFKRGFIPMIGDVQNALPNILYRNRPDGTFEDVTAQAGVGDKRIALAAGAFDMDNDGDQDLYVVNDMQRNMLFENLGNGKFREISTAAKVDDLGNGMGITFADLNRDRYLDMFLTNISMWNPRTRYVRPELGTRLQSTKELDSHIRSRHTNRLFLNTRRRSFRDETATLIPRLGQSSWGWNNFFFDFNNDGLSDLYMINGFRPESLFHHEEKKLLLQQRTDGQFALVPALQSGAALASNSRSGVFFDADLDGDLDLVVTGLHSPVFYVNQAPPQNWLDVKLIGKRSNRDGYGALVTVETPPSQTLQMGNAGGGFVSSINGPLHFGLGAARAVTLRVRWPGGRSQVVKTAANHVVTIREN